MDFPEASLLGIPQELRDKIWMNLLCYEEPIRITSVILHTCRYGSAKAPPKVSYAKSTYFRNGHNEPQSSTISMPPSSSLYGSGTDLPANPQRASRGPLIICKSSTCMTCLFWQQGNRNTFMWEDFSVLDVFFVNSQVHKEASKIFYANNTFHFTLTSSKNDRDITAFTNFLVDRPLHVRGSLRCVSLELHLYAGIEMPNPRADKQLDRHMMKQLQSLLAHEYNIRDLRVLVDGPTFLTNHLQYFAHEGKAERERAIAIIDTFSSFRKLQKFHITVRAENIFTTHQASRDLVRLIDSKIVGKAHDLKDGDILHDPNPPQDAQYSRREHFETFSFKRRIG